MPAKGWRKKVCQKCGCAFWRAPGAPVICMGCQVASFLAGLFVLFILFLLLLICFFFPYYAAVGLIIIVSFVVFLIWNESETNTGNQEDSPVKISSQKFSKTATHENVRGVIKRGTGLSSHDGNGLKPRYVTVERSENSVWEKNFSQHTQIGFDSKLRQMIQEARSKKGQEFCPIVAKHLHDRVFIGPQTNRMQRACDAMWKLWKEQGSRKDRIIYTTPSGQSSTITIVFAAYLTTEDDDEKKLQQKYTQEIDSELQQILQEARNKRQQFCKITPQRWHNRDVATLMPLACKVMWKLWEKQGRYEKRIIDTTPRSQSPTIMIKFDTSLTEEDEKELLLKYTQEINSELQQILQEARNKKEQFCTIFSKHLHDRVVKELRRNQIPLVYDVKPLVYDVMWKLWKEQGSYKKRIIKSISDAQSSFIRIIFDTGLPEEDKIQKFWKTKMFNWKFWQEATIDDVVKAITDGADINALGKDEDTPLHWAVRFNSKSELIALLLDSGANINALDKNGDTPLHWAVRFNRKSEVIALLLDSGANINALDKNGDTPLHWAAAFSRTPEVISLLLDRGAKTNVQDKGGHTPYDCVKDNKYLQGSSVIKLLEVT